MDILDTPCLLLDRPILEQNIDRMLAHTSQMGVDLRVHIKTSKCADVARMVVDRGGVGITVSTVKEAIHFFELGFIDMVYAVGVVPSKLDRLADLIRRGARVKLTVDSTEMATAVVSYADEADVGFDVLIEVDTDGHRMGVEPDGQDFLKIASLFAGSKQIRLCGILAHAGESYRCTSPEEIAIHAEQERRLSCVASQALRDSGMECSVVSVGSTPTITFAANLNGISEVRPGNFVFFDLFQAGLGVCRIEDIAVRVLTTIIGRNESTNRLFVDAGALALSKDLGTGGQDVDQRFGLVRESIGMRDELIVTEVSQEHGTITTRSGEKLDFDRFPIGSQLTLLPVHSCMTSAAYDGYHVVDSEGTVEAFWQRCNGW
jgi:D-serine deaminase-like pyridoxal phosphate-dependent protein